MANGRLAGALIIAGLILIASRKPVGAFTAPAVAPEAVAGLAAQEGITEEQARQELQEAAIAAGTGPRATIPGAPAFSSPEEETAYIMWAYTQAGIDYNAWVSGEVGVSAMTDAQLAKNQEILETQVTLGETQPWLAQQAEIQLTEVNIEIALREATEAEPEPPWEAPAPEPSSYSDAWSDAWAAATEAEPEPPWEAPAPEPLSYSDAWAAAAASGYAAF